MSFGAVLSHQSSSHLRTKGRRSSSPVFDQERTPPDASSELSALAPNTTARAPVSGIPAGVTKSSSRTGPPLRRRAASSPPSGLSSSRKKLVVAETPHLSLLASGPPAMAFKGRSGTKLLPSGSATSSADNAMQMWQARANMRSVRYPSGVQELIASRAGANARQRSIAIRTASHDTEVMDGIESDEEKTIDLGSQSSSPVHARTAPRTPSDVGAATDVNHNEQVVGDRMMAPQKSSSEVLPHSGSRAFGGAGNVEPVTKDADADADADMDADAEADPNWQLVGAEMLRRLFKVDDASIFLIPVDPKRDGVPDYFKIIKRPMDLGTVSNNLMSGQYNSLDEMFSDIELTFQNAIQYNPEDNPAYASAVAMLKTFHQQREAMRQYTTGTAEAAGAGTGPGHVRALKRKRATAGSADASPSLELEVGLEHTPPASSSSSKSKLRKRTRQAAEPQVLQRQDTLVVSQDDDDEAEVDAASDDSDSEHKEPDAIEDEMRLVDLHEMDPSGVVVIPSFPIGALEDKSAPLRPMLNAAVSTRGKRVTQQDFYAMEGRIPGTFVAGTCDGHGWLGQNASLLCSQLIPTKYTAFVKAGIQPEEAFRVAIAETNDMVLQIAEQQYASTVSSGLLKRPALFDYGTTVCMFGLHERKHLVVANVGDSRCVLLSRPRRKSTKRVKVNPPAGDWKVTPLTTDHTCDAMPSEGDRVKSQGGQLKTNLLETRVAPSNVTFQQAKTQKLSLNMTRALGHRIMGRHGISPLPDISTHKLQENHEYLIITASDGVWGVVENSELRDLVTCLETRAANGGAGGVGASAGLDPYVVCEALVKLSDRRWRIRPGFGDNVTATVTYIP